MDPSAIAVAGLATTIGAGAWSAGVWAVRLEGRLSAHETADAIIHQNVDSSLTDLKATVASIDGKVDRLVERLIPHA